jgi:hypothetical protein
MEKVFFLSIGIIQYNGDIIYAKILIYPEKCKVFNKNVKILGRERENVCGKKTLAYSLNFRF